MPGDLPSSERRDFFRIEDRIGVEYRPLDPAIHLPTDPFGNDHVDDLRTELKRFDLDIRNQLAVLAERDRLTASLIKSINGKLDTLARIMAFEQNPLQPQDWQSVTLSEGGISFSVPPGEAAPGDSFALRLTLPPELFRPRATVRVLGITPGDGSSDRVHAEFTGIQEADRQQIAKHVMRWQIRQRQGADGT
ncbi:PilZ domain-containing protein [uncultured Marinobacter sp.]|uniref:PilZ domain-containing protein n=1 Tax=uncultured Marinobacter sp. TaxID=187379 RepID=UPI0030D9CF42